MVTSWWMLTGREFAWFCATSIFFKTLPISFAWITTKIFSFPVMTDFLLRIFQIFFWRSLQNVITSVVFVRRWRWIMGWGEGVSFSRRGFNCAIRLSRSFTISFRFWLSSSLSDSALYLVNWSCFRKFSSLSFVVWSCLPVFQIQVCLWSIEVVLGSFQVCLWVCL